jgi:hypothetical protein
LSVDRDVQLTTDNRRRIVAWRCLTTSGDGDLFVEGGLADRRLEFIGRGIVLPLGLLLFFELLLLAASLFALPFRKGNLWSTQIHLLG